MKLYGGNPVLDIRDKETMPYPAAYRIIFPRIREGKKFGIAELSTGAWEVFVVRSCRFLLPGEVAAEAAAEAAAEKAKKRRESRVRTRTNARYKAKAAKAQTAVA